MGYCYSQLRSGGDHGEEIQSEEEIREEGRSGAQEEENRKVGCAEAGKEGRQEVRQESGQEGRQKGGSEAEGRGEEARSGEKARPAGTRSRADAGSGVACSPDHELGFRQRQQHLTGLGG
jgi:hypothetical protein